MPVAMDSLLLPKVSVVIVNYNYDDYLETAFESVAGQTYPNIEIVIVDDKSTDDSCRTIDKICEKNPAVVPVKLEKNGGQSVASSQGVAAASGGYIVFLDADDQLLPECVEAHVYAHLSSRFPVAFSTVDVINNAGGQDINMSHAGFSEYVESQKGLRPNAVRPVEKSMPSSWFGPRAPAAGLDQLHFVLPPHVDPWVWSPTSANCFRRDAVNMLLKGPGLVRLRWGTDAYMMRPLSGLFGSILIDRPLVRYIIHARNRFTKGAPLNKLLFFDTSATSEDIRVMARTGIERLMADAAEIGPRFDNPWTFFDTIKTLSECWPGPRPGEAPGEYLKAQLLAHEETLKKGFGQQIVADVLNSRLRFSEKGRRLMRKSERA